MKVDKKLKAEWYAKLKKSGFEDLESSEHGVLKNTITSGGIIDQRRWGTWKQNQEYYSMATQFLNEYTFKSKLQRIIWEYHSNGISAINITAILKKVKIKKTNREYVGQIIRELREIMKKMYKVTSV